MFCVVSPMHFTNFTMWILVSFLSLTNSVLVWKISCSFVGSYWTVPIKSFQPVQMKNFPQSSSKCLFIQEVTFKLKKKKFCEMLQNIERIHYLIWRLWIFLFSVFIKLLLTRLLASELFRKFNRLFSKSSLIAVVSLVTDTVVDTVTP